MEKHFTTSVYVYNTETKKFLFIKHKKLQKWLQPGGHIEENENPEENIEEIHNTKAYTNVQDFELVNGYCNEYLELINNIRKFYYDNNSYLLNEQK